MNEPTKVSTPTDAELRALWNQAGGTIYSTSQELGSMPLRKLLPFLRQLGAGGAAVPDVVASPYEIALRALVAAALPGLDTGDLLADAAKATAAFGPAELAAHFGIDDEPCSDGSARYLQIGVQHAGDPDVFPLFRRAPLAADATPAPRDPHVDGMMPAPATARTPRAASGKKASGGQGGAS